MSPGGQKRERRSSREMVKIDVSVWIETEGMLDGGRASTATFKELKQDFRKPLMQHILHNTTNVLH